MQYFFVRIEIVRIEFIYVCVYSSENNSCSYVTVEIMTYNLTTFRNVALTIASCAIVAPVIAVDCMCMCNTLKFNVEYK